jgi:hypothetical protein
MKNKKIIAIPGAFQYVKNYGGYDGVDIWLKEKLNKEKVRNADFVVAHSLGANYVFSFPASHNQKFILVNPSVKKRSFVNLIIRDFKYLLSKEISLNKVIPISSWFYAFWKAYKLSKIDILGVLRKIPKENIFIIRGKRDKFFCDNETIDLIKKENFSLIEVDAGYDWNQNIAEMTNKIILNES